MITVNHFQFGRKNFFNFSKMIYGFENCKSFSKFKLFILVRTFMGIRHRLELEFVGSLNLPLKVPEFWNPIAEIRQLPPKF